MLIYLLTIHATSTYSIFYKCIYLRCIVPITSTHPTKIRFPKKDIQQDRENILKKSNRHFVYLK